MDRAAGVEGAAAVPPAAHGAGGEEADLDPDPDPGSGSISHGWGLRERLTATPPSSYHS